MLEFEEPETTTAIHVLIPDSDLDFVRAQAKRTRAPMAQIVRQMIAFARAEHERAEDMKEEKA